MDIESKEQASTNMSSLSAPFNLSSIANTNNLTKCQDTPNLNSTQQNNLYQPEVMLEQQVKGTIQTNKSNLAFVGWLQITDSQYTLRFLLGQNNGSGVENQDQLVYLSVQYGTTETIGTSQDCLVIFINSDKDQPNDDQQQNGENSQNIADQVFQLINNQKKGNFFLRGQCTLTLQFLAKQYMQKAYQLLSLYVGEQDEGNSEYGEDEDMEEMISADNIDENGNIIVNNGNQSGSDQEEDEEPGEMQDQNQQGSHNLS